MSPNLRVVHIGPEGRGGIDRVIERLSGVQQQSAALEVRRLVTTGRGSRFHKAVVGTRSLTWIRQNRSWLHSAVAHIHVATGTSFYRKAVLLQLARRAGARVLLHLHGSHTPEWYAGRSAPVQAWIRSQLDAADALLSVNEAWLPFYRHLTATPVQCIYNGVDLDAWNCVPRAPSQQDRPVRVLYLGRIDDAKGTYHLLEAVRQLHRREGRGVSLCLAGNGEMDRARAWARERGIEDHVTVTGWLTPDAVRTQLQQADILVLPSVASESFGLVLIEAMAAGLPVVASQVGGIPEIVEDGQSGLLVPPSDPAGLAEALQQLAQNPELREKMGSRGRAIAEARFNLDTIAEQVEDLYRQLLS